ncbi:MAG: NAD(P)H-dependent oxidoreductase subunit E [Phycisphaerae bacterium]
MSEQSASPIDISRTVKKWSGKRGSLIMMLHDIQGQFGYVPRDVALKLAEEVNVPLARIYEVLTFYNYFKTSLPGKAVVSVCTGTACHLKGAPEVLAALSEELGIEDGETTEDGNFHLQSVRCVGCCGLAPVVVVNNKTYGKVKPAEVRGIVGEWREMVESGQL